MKSNRLAQLVAMAMAQVHQPGLAYRPSPTVNRKSTTWRKAASMPRMQVRDPEKEAAAEAKRQRKCAKRLSDQASCSENYYFV